VAGYLSINFLQKFAGLPFVPPETDDFILLDFFTSQGCFGTNFPVLGSATRTPDHSPHTPTQFPPEPSLWDLKYLYLVAGEIKIHNAATHGSRVLSTNEENESAPYFDRAMDLGFTLLNTPGVYTRFPFTGTHRPSVIDLAFANQQIFLAFCSWDASALASTGFDHAPIIISRRPPSHHNDEPRPRWQEADWPGLADRLENWPIPPRPDPLPPSQLDQ